MDRTGATVSDLLQALFIASGHEKKLPEQKLLALCLIDWALQECSEADAEELRREAHGAHKS